ncbi:hypothetical protein EIN_016110 [Entamoeba invadens IP1]|uniref:hypothetical protein n=1 Tax=Entamoeba invadens IP1 TaxID=370355 RepID=UPI0002C3DC92|nr:hypothetical protein EIN_016110 [Entamoeba invadens IP1]ELP90402.1 hypothetical protein EIN_016110 [Entamoeba invadens IP1]|eukprot:XP_004257173.1 hypothetical protein EIN_016110 [Entamoeba invadens IP1]
MYRKAVIFILLFFISFVHSNYVYQLGDEKYQSINSRFPQIEKDVNRYVTELNQLSKKYVNPVLLCYGKVNQDYSAFKNDFKEINVNVSKLRENYTNMDMTLNKTAYEMTEVYLKKLKSENEFDRYPDLFNFNNTVFNLYSRVYPYYVNKSKDFDNTKGLIKTMKKQFKTLKTRILQCKGNYEKINQTIESSSAMTNWKKLVNISKTLETKYQQTKTAFLSAQGYRCNLKTEEKIFETLRKIVEERTLKYDPGVVGRIEKFATAQFEWDEEDIKKNRLHLKDNFYTQPNYREIMLKKYKMNHIPNDNTTFVRKRVSTADLIKQLNDSSLFKYIELAKKLDDKKFVEKEVKKANIKAERQMSGEATRDVRRKVKEDMRKQLDEEIAERLNEKIKRNAAEIAKMRSVVTQEELKKASLAVTPTQRVHKEIEEVEPSVNRWKKANELLDKFEEEGIHTKKLKEMLKDLTKDQIEIVYRKLKYSIAPIESLVTLAKLYKKENKMMKVENPEKIRTYRKQLRREERRLLKRFDDGEEEDDKKGKIDFDDANEKSVESILVDNTLEENPDEVIHSLERRVREKENIPCGCQNKRNTLL